MTLDQMLSDLYRRLAYSPTPATDVVTRLTAFLNEALQDVMSEPGLGEWITRNVPSMTFGTFPGQATYGLPITQAARITAITDRTNDLRLTMRPFDWYRWQEPDPTANSGTPTVWVPLGSQPVAQQPPVASALYVSSTVPTDTTQVATVESNRLGGLPSSYSVTLAGFTRVQIVSTVQEAITRFRISALADGEVELWVHPTSGVQLAHIPVGRLESRYSSLALWPTPSANLTYTVDAERELGDLVALTDEPPFPLRFHRILIEGALMREYAKRGDAGLEVVAERHYDRIMGQLHYFVTCPPDFLPSRQMWPVERSRLGPQFPATRWPR